MLKWGFGLLDENGKDIKYFKVSMPNPCRIKEQPTGKGLLGAVIKKGQTIRLDDVTKDWRSIKLPENHPPIRTLLGVPLVTNRSTVSGGLFLANKANNECFTLDDEEILLTITYHINIIKQGIETIADKINTIKHSGFCKEH